MCVCVCVFVRASYRQNSTRVCYCQWGTDVKRCVVWQKVHLGTIELSADEHGQPSVFVTDMTTCFFMSSGDKSESRG